jgi:hypothetical protein
MTLKSDLDKLAKALLNQASEGAKLEEQVDIFKAVATYFTNTQRIAKGKPPEDEGMTFGKLVGGLKNTQPGGSA